MFCFYLNRLLVFLALGTDRNSRRRFEEVIVQLVQRQRVGYRVQSLLSWHRHVLGEEVTREVIVRGVAARGVT